MVAVLAVPVTNSIVGNALVSVSNLFVKEIKLADALSDVAAASPTKPMEVINPFIKAIKLMLPEGVVAAVSPLSPIAVDSNCITSGLLVVPAPEVVALSRCCPAPSIYLTLGILKI
ncbi:MAG: hypothetical protein EBY75_09095 [Actinobacteria bacterium]|nr:hypothetical protein [Actinomycetota bacterium]